MAQLAEGLPGLYKTQSSIPSTAQTAFNLSVIPKHGSGVRDQHVMCERKGVRKKRGGEGKEGREEAGKLTQERNGRPREAFGVDHPHRELPRISHQPLSCLTSLVMSGGDRHQPLLTYNLHNNTKLLDTDRGSDTYTDPIYDSKHVPGQSRNIHA